MLRSCLLLLVMTAVFAADGGPKEVLRQIIDANNHSDAEAVGRLYAEDAVWLPPTGPLVEGKANILERYKRSFATTRLRYTYEEVESHIAGDWAFSRGFTKGEAVPVDGSAAKMIHDKYLMILRRDHGTWKIARLMWSPAN
jgi:uncharacterized protein (TIGR02246 family)